MSKLTKVQKKLKDMGIKHEVHTRPEDYSTVETTDIEFWDVEGNRYGINEHTGSSGAKTVQGIMVRGSKDFKGDYWNQGNIVEWLENNKDKFEGRQSLEDGKIEIWLTTYEHEVSLHSTKLSVINSANNRYIDDFDTVEDALHYANNNNIEVISIKNK